MIKGTTILVVIGYSFPFFNREVDKKIINNIKKSGNLFKKIYYQDPIKDGQQLRSQFDIKAGHVEIVHIKDTTNFFVPFEY